MRTNSSIGNDTLRTLSPMAVRSRLKGELADDPAALQRWQDYSDGARDVEATYSTANFRGFEKGERRSCPRSR